MEDFPKEGREASIDVELKKVNTWLKLNTLALNVDKTKSILFERRPIALIKFIDYYKSRGSILNMLRKIYIRHNEWENK